MSKRTVDPDKDGGVSLKAGGRPQLNAQGDGEDVQFEDDFEDEFEEDEVIVAGEDGQPDDEREEDEGDGMLCTTANLQQCLEYLLTPRCNQKRWSWTVKLLSQADTN